MLRLSLRLSGPRKPPVREPPEAPPVPPDGAPPAPPAAPESPPAKSALHTVDRATALEAMRFYPAILAWVRRCGVPPGDVEDVAIEVMLVALARWTAFVPQDEEHPAAARRTWLFVITYRAAGAWRRRAARVELRAPDDIEALSAKHTHPSPEEVALAREAQSERAAEVRLEALRPGTSAENWRAFVAHEVEGLQVTAIARLEGVPVSTIYNRLRVARRDLRAAIQRVRARLAFTQTTAKPRRTR